MIIIAARGNSNTSTARVAYFEPELDDDQLGCLATAAAAAAAAARCCRHQDDRWSGAECYVVGFMASCMGRHKTDNFPQYSVYAILTNDCRKEAC